MIDKRRFSLRSILWILTGAAVLSAVLSPYIRTLEPYQQLRLAILLGILLSTSLVSFCFTFLKYEQCVARAGKELLSLENESFQKRASIVAWILMIVVGSLLMPTGFGYFLLVTESSMFSEPRQSVFEFYHLFIYVVVAVSGLQLGWLLSNLFFVDSATTLRFCENGIHHSGNLFAEWRKITLRYWDRESHELKLQMNGTLVTCLIPAQDCEAVDQIITSHLAPPPPPKSPFD